MALAYGQKFAYNMTKKELCKDDPDHPTNDHSYVDAELDGVEMEFDITVYHRVKFMLKRKTLKGAIYKKTKMRNFMLIERQKRN